VAGSGLIAAVATLQFTTARQESQTSDECRQLLSRLHDNLDCVAVISVANLAVHHNRFAGLDQIQPSVNDLRKRPEATGHGRD
jgi:hypothetical protein